MQKWQSPKSFHKSRFNALREKHYTLFWIWKNAILATDILFFKNLENDLWLKIFKSTSFRLLELQSSTGKSE